VFLEESCEIDTAWDSVVKTALVNTDFRIELMADCPHLPALFDLDGMGRCVAHCSCIRRELPLIHVSLLKRIEGTEMFQGTVLQTVRAYRSDSFIDSRNNVGSTFALHQPRIV